MHEEICNSHTTIVQIHLYFFCGDILQVCHIVLGLRPASEKEEGEIILCWLKREERRGYSVGQFWYFISFDWWCSWEGYVKASEFSVSTQVYVKYAVCPECI